jgi:hypothetical protein
MSIDVSHFCQGCQKDHRSTIWYWRESPNLDTPYWLCEIEYLRLSAPGMGSWYFLSTGTPKQLLRDVLQTNLMVEGFPASFTDQDLKNLFAPFGSVISVSIVRDVKGQSLRIGHVEMAGPQEAQRAKENLYMSYVQGKRLLVFLEEKRNDLHERGLFR